MTHEGRVEPLDSVVEALSPAASDENQSAAERRREPRYATDRITLLYVGDQSDSERMFCRILDISDSGMRVRTPRRLEPGTEVRVTLREMQGIARVRYCVAVEKAFDHGLQVESVRAADGVEAVSALSLLA